LRRRTGAVRIASYAADARSALAFSTTAGTRLLTLVMPKGITRPNSPDRLRIWLACDARSFKQPQPGRECGHTLLSR
jgi:hypothetical protein